MVEAGSLHGANRESGNMDETALKQLPKPKITRKHGKEHRREALRGAKEAVN